MTGTGVVAFVRRAQPQATEVFDSYWRFASERHQVFLRRLHGAAAPWTHNPVIQSFKFTNAFRVLDRTSQYLLSEVIYDRERGASDTLFRILLFKIFNRVDTWELIQRTLGEVSIQTFRADACSEVLDRAMGAGTRIYSAAYIMPSGPASIRQARKHHMHLALLQKLILTRFFDRMSVAPSLELAYLLLREVPSFGPFLAFQYAIDFNYSSHLRFSEMDFVVAGPGARDGIRKCFTDMGGYSEGDLIRWVADRQEREFAARNLPPATLWGRPLQLVDCQNLFCEVDKYARAAHPELAGISGRTRIKQRYAATGRRQLSVLLPPKWKVKIPRAALRSIGEGHREIRRGLS